MLHYVKNEQGEPTIWRDPADIQEEIADVNRRIASAHTCYAVLEHACKSLRELPEESEGTRNLFGTLLGEAHAILDEIDDECGRINLLQKELRETRCLLLRM